MPDDGDVGETIIHLQKVILDLKADVINLSVWGEEAGARLVDVMPCLSDPSRQALDELIFGG